MEIPHSPILIYDREGILGEKLALLLSKKHVIYFISHRRKNSALNKNIFISTSIPPHIQFVGYILIPSVTKSFHKDFTKLITNARKTLSPILYIETIKNTSTITIAKVATMYEYMRFLLVGEIKAIQKTTIETMIRDALISKKIVLTNGGLEKVYLTDISLLGHGILEIIKYGMSGRRVYFFFSQNPPTKFMLAEIIKKRIPTQIIFKNARTPTKKYLLPPQGSYMFINNRETQDIAAVINEEIENIQHTSLAVPFHIAGKQRVIMLLILVFMSYYILGFFSAFLLTSAARYLTNNEFKAITPFLVHNSESALIGIESLYDVLPLPVQNSIDSINKQNDYLLAIHTLTSPSPSKANYSAKILNQSKLKQQLCVTASCEATQNIFTQSGILPYLFAGFDGERRYLLLFVNEHDLQPGGGSIYAYATSQVQNGNIMISPVRSVASLDATLEQQIEPPLFQQLAYGTNSLYLRDSAYSEDVVKNAEVAAFLFNLETQQSIDGVLYLSTHALQTIYSIQSEEMQKFITDTTDEKILALNSYVKKKIESPVSVYDSLLLKKDLQISLTNHYEEELFENWRIPLSHIPNKQTIISDIFGIVEGNIGRNDVSSYITRDLSQNISIARGLVTSHITLHIANHSSENTKGGGEYKAYFQIMIPKKAILQDITTNGTIQHLIMNSRKTSSEKSTINITQEEGMVYTKYGWFISIPSFERHKIEITYTYPYNHLPNTYFYDLEFIKQAGMGELPYDLTYEDLDRNVHVSITKTLERDSRMQFKVTKNTITRL